MQTLFGLFDNYEAAQSAYYELLKEGFKATDIEVLTSTNTQELTGLKNSLDDPDIDFYVESVRKGGTLISVDAPENKVNAAANILSRHGMVDVDARVEQLRAQGSDVRLRDYRDNDQVLQVIEESLVVGKREVERGRVRVYNRITERVVEEQIGLRDETINVQRRVVDRPLSGAELESAFQERSFEVTEVDEEAVVGKVARVVEEVVISKDVAQNIETVRDTVRRSDVEVEEYTTGQSPATRQEGYTTEQYSTTREYGDYVTESGTTRQYGDYDTEFRSYYDRELSGSGMTYEQYGPAFRYGHQLADRFRGRGWSDIEADGRRIWEEKNPGTWDKFRPIIHYSYERVHNR